jgi:hypothetical protein
MTLLFTIHSGLSVTMVASTLMEKCLETYSTIKGAPE